MKRCPKCKFEVTGKQPKECVRCGFELPTVLTIEMEKTSLVNKILGKNGEPPKTESGGSKKFTDIVKALDKHVKNEIESTKSLNRINMLNNPFDSTSKNSVMNGDIKLKLVDEEVQLEQNFEQEAQVEVEDNNSMKGGLNLKESNILKHINLLDDVENKKEVEQKNIEDAPLETTSTETKLKKEETNIIIETTIEKPTQDNSLENDLLSMLDFGNNNEEPISKEQNSSESQKNELDLLSEFSNPSSKTKIEANLLEKQNAAKSEELNLENLLNLESNTEQILEQNNSELNLESLLGETNQLTENPQLVENVNQIIENVNQIEDDIEKLISATSNIKKPPRIKSELELTYEKELGRELDDEELQLLLGEVVNEETQEKVEEEKPSSSSLDALNEYTLKIEEPRASSISLDLLMEDTLSIQDTKDSSTSLEALMQDSLASEDNQNNSGCYELSEEDTDLNSLLAELERGLDDK